MPTTLTLAKDIIAAAEAAGICGHTYNVTWTRGYVPRRDRSIDADLLYVAGGSCKGCLYMLSGSYDSTTYCHRIYLGHAEGGPLRVDDLRRAGIHCHLHKQVAGRAASAGVAIAI